MRRSRFTETQIVSILKEADAGASVKDIRRHQQRAAHGRARYPLRLSTSGVPTPAGDRP